MHDLKLYVLKPLTLLGALNWGLIGLFNWDLVAALLGAGTSLTRIVYTIIGIAAVVCIVLMSMPRGEK